MIFLNPSILFGLLAASIPVVIHLLNLRKLKKIEFSTLAFLKKLEKNKIRKIKLKQWLLLALRVLIILLIVLAFSRPALEGTAIGGTTSAAKTTSVFIIDDSFSMSIVDEKGSSLNKAKETIKELINHLQEGDEAALITTTSRNEDDIAVNILKQVSTKAEQVKTSYVKGNIHNAIVQAAKIIGDSKNFNKEVYIFSDFQKSNLGDEKQFSDLGSMLDEGVKIYSFDYKSPEVLNLSISNIRLNSGMFEKDIPLLFDVIVDNKSFKDADDGVLSIFVENERTAQQSFTIEKGTSKTLSIEVPIKKSGNISIQAKIEDDAIKEDNSRFFSLFIPREIPVLIMGDKQEDLNYISLALAASNETGALKINEKLFSQVNALNLNDYHSIIIAGSGNPGIAKLKSYVENGGGLFLLPGSSSTLSSFNQLVSPLTGVSASSLVGNPGQNITSYKFNNVDFEHPLFTNLFVNEKKHLESPDIFAYYKINIGGGKKIISMSDGSAFLSEMKSGKGKILLLNTAPVLNWTNFPMKGIFPSLMNKIVYYLAFKNNVDDEIFPGDKIILTNYFKTASGIKINAPQGNEIFVNKDDSLFNSGLTPMVPGIYHLSSGDKEIDHFAVNTDPAESDLSFLSISEIEKYFKAINFKGKLINVDVDKNPVDIVMQSRFGTELWKYFLIFALIIMAVEMLVAKNAKKDLVP
ncbi:MAG TPA: BatA domain-containing protein [Ignavibacteriaceae bacterium]|nr:BatA domain-containing protein [Ignavibacteriaceae bacterium]